MRWKNAAGRLALWGVFGTAGLVLSGCGGGTPASNSPPPPPPPSATISIVGAYYAQNSYISLPYAIAGQGAFQLLVNGAGFTSSSVVDWNGSPLPTQFGDSTDLAANVSSDLIAAPGKAMITVVNPGGVTSKGVEFQIASPATATAGVVQLVSAAPDGSPANGGSAVTSVSATGRYVTMNSNATNLTSGPVSAYGEIYERDTCVGAPPGCVPTTIHVSVAYDGSPENNGSGWSAVSADGRYVAFSSDATNILPESSACGDGHFCVFLRDTCIGAPSGCTPTTIPVSVNAQGQLVSGDGPVITPDGRFVNFDGRQCDFGVGPCTEASSFTRDTCIGAPSGCTPATYPASLTYTGAEENQTSNLGEISATGRFSAFISYATNMVPNEGPLAGVFWRDTCLGASSGCAPTTLRADVPNGGGQPNNGEDSDLFIPVSADGRFVAFGSGATNLVSANVNANCPVFQGVGCSHVYVRDTCTGAPAGCTPRTSLVSIANDGSMENCSSPGNLGGQSLSADGRFVAFGSISTNLSPDDTFPACGWEDIFVRDTCFGAPSGCVPSTVRVSVANYAQPGGSADSICISTVMSADGHYVVFTSPATDFLSTPSNGHDQVWLAKTGF